MKETKTTRPIFVIVDLAKKEQDQKSLIDYAIAQSEQLQKPLVLYPKRDDTNIGFETARALLLGMVSIDALKRTSVSKRKISPLNFFTSLCDIAKKENADLILHGIQKQQSSLWGNAISTTERSTIPVLLVPDGIGFVPITNIVIAADSSFKLQKTNQAIWLAKTCGANIVVFKENNPKDGKIEIITQQICKYLLANDVSFEIVTAEKREKFAKNMFKYASKHAQLLIIEVDPGKIDETTKKNIATLMSVDAYASMIPVLITKTRDTKIALGKF